MWPIEHSRGRVAQSTRYVLPRFSSRTSESSCFNNRSFDALPFKPLIQARAIPTNV
jgi:hypothetical protein